MTLHGNPPISTLTEHSTDGWQIKDASIHVTGHSEWIRAHKISTQLNNNGQFWGNVLRCEQPYRFLKAPETRYPTHNDCFLQHTNAQFCSGNCEKAAHLWVNTETTHLSSQETEMDIHHESKLCRQDKDLTKFAHLHLPVLFQSVIFSLTPSLFWMYIGLQLGTFVIWHSILYATSGLTNWDQDTQWHY